MRIGEARSDKELAQLMIPGTGSLFETIGGPTKFADIMRMMTIDKYLWLTHVYILRKGN